MGGSLDPRDVDRHPMEIVAPHCPGRECDPGCIGPAPRFSRRPCSGVPGPAAHGAIRRRSPENGTWFSDGSAGVKADAFHRMFKVLAQDADFEHAVIDGSIVRVHRHAQGAKGGPGAGPSDVLAAA